jgi:hypothetical protein
MQMRRFDGATDWLAPVAAVEVGESRAARSTFLRRASLALVATASAVTLALALATQAKSALRPVDPGLEVVNASWSSGFGLGVTDSARDFSG